jgi:hypothetical protein
MTAQLPTFMAFKNGENIGTCAGVNQMKLHVRVSLLFSSRPLPLTMLYCRNWSTRSLMPDDLYSYYMKLHAPAPSCPHLIWVSQVPNRPA